MAFCIPTVKDFCMHYYQMEETDANGETVVFEELEQRVKPQLNQLPTPRGS